MRWNDLELFENGRKTAEKMRMSEALKNFNQKNDEYYKFLTIYSNKRG
ncbi:hypothetical protein PAJ34TS1_65080 [Paenibacillus azoreducens]|uniref:Uncharacterized protein n=1 Tax=Paenibacillus azoreducens TaxID=116718 RepID=A0A919YHP0_9BACL|nr:hypothetical protein J34TS1_55860 [Paenibacillus azoreducens]